MAVTLAPVSWTNPCTWALVKEACHAVGGAAAKVGGAVLDGIVQPLAVAMGTVLRSLLTFWLKWPSPDFADPSGPVSHLQHLNVWITGVVGVVALLIAAARLALTRGEKSTHQIMIGLFAITISGMAVPLVGLLAQALDNYSQWVLTQGNTGFDDRAGMFIEGFSTLSPGLILILAPIIVICSVGQILLLIVRVGVLTILLGCLPIVAASATTETGMHALRRVIGWLVAFLLYSPLAATIYAAAFLMVGTGKDITSVLAGLATIVLALIAMPALLRAVQPVMSAVTFAGGGGAAAGAAALGATGARLVSSKSSESSSTSNTSPPIGAAPASASKGAAMNGGVGAAGAAGANGASGAAGATGAAGAGASAGGAAAGGAAAAAGPVGIGVMAVTQTVGKVKTAAQSSVPSGNNGQSNGHREEP